jgi:hypothetical protein
MHMLHPLAMYALYVFGLRAQRADPGMVSSAA